MRYSAPPVVLLALLLAVGCGRSPDDQTVVLDQWRAAVDEKVEKIANELEDKWGSFKPEIGSVPIGGIIPYAGPKDLIDQLPGKWHLCDGLNVDGEVYPELLAAIGASWGDGGDEDPNTFNLPDLRGLFLRGVNHTATTDGQTAVDPDVETRDASGNGGNTGNLVGSIQQYATGLPSASFWANLSHVHSFSDTLGSEWKLKGNFGADHFFRYGKGVEHQPDKTEPGLTEKQNTSQGGGDPETRPVNAYVNWIIRMK